MPSAATLRTQIEQFLQNRIPAALTPAPRTIRDLASTGIGSIDDLLQGGLPVGAITEITGVTSSGRTSLALSFLAQRTAEGRFCAWVDASDSLDPQSAAANGVALSQLLWIRCSENRHKPSARTWTQMDQAIRAADLLLHAGGFASIVLDLASIAREYARRIPLATWFRFRQAAERTRASLLVLGQTACAQSSAAVVLECASLRAASAGGTVLRGFHAQIGRGRERFAPVEIGTRKPPVATWEADAQWQAASEGMEKRA